jgi:hypothetical protein
MATELQKRALNLKLQRIKEKKPISMAEIMIEAGYSKKAAEYPKRLIESKGWQELTEEYLPDEKLLKLHSELLFASKDARVKGEMLKEAYKLKDKYPEQRTKIMGLFGALEEKE